MLTQEVWLGADNKFTLQLNTTDITNNTKTPTDLISVNKLELYITDRRGNDFAIVTLSTDNPRYINWIEPEATGYVVFQLGIPLAALNVPPGTYYTELQVYDPANPNGIVWFSVDDKDLVLKVREQR